MRAQTICHADRVSAWPFRPSCYKDMGNTRANWFAGIYDKLPIIQTIAQIREDAFRSGYDSALDRMQPSGPIGFIGTVEDGLERFRASIDAAHRTAEAS